MSTVTGRIRYVGQRTVEVQVRLQREGGFTSAVVVGEVPPGLALDLVTERFTVPINRALRAGDTLTFGTSAAAL